MLDSFTRGGTAVVFGATGGIGAAVATALDDSGRFDTVFRFGRSTVPGFDLTDEASIEGLAEQVAQHASPPKLVFDATGSLHGDGLEPEKSLRHIDGERLARAFQINATGPALLMKHFLPLLPREGKTVFATISAKVGSIGDNRFGGWYGYRASKAALNQIVRTAAIELGRRRPDAVLLALHPGTVDTDLSRPFGKAGLTVRTPEDSARRMLAVIDRATAAQTGGFLSYTGETIVW